jgi:hypothetical protein
MLNPPSLGNKGSRALLGIENAANFHLSISTNHRIGINGQIDGHAANGRKLVANAQGSRSDRSLNLVNELPIDRDAALVVQPKGELKPGEFA